MLSICCGTGSLRKLPSKTALPTVNAHAPARRIAWTRSARSMLPAAITGRLTARTTRWVSASTSPTLQPGDPGYMLGIRVQGDPDKETKCGTLINYAVFNNILAGSGSMTDPLGNVVAPGF